MPAEDLCLRHVTVRKRITLVREDAGTNGGEPRGPEVDEALRTAERAQLAADLMAHLPKPWQELLEHLMAGPPVSYAGICDHLVLPISSIGAATTRGRCLTKSRVLLEAS
jgi:hypothetical protein